VTRGTLARRVFAALLGVLVLGFTASAIFGERGYFDLAGQSEERSRLTAQVALARARNSALESAITDLTRGGPLLESAAREELGYIKPGEVTFLFPPESSDPTPAPAPVSPQP